MFRVRVPASSANLGPGFDCMGIALKLYNTADFEKIESGFEINILDESRAYIPTNENNLVYKSMKALFQKAGVPMGGVRITMNSEIPVTRGLGSSSAGIIMGLLGANRLLNNKFSTDELLYIASGIEGHPDNVTPALLGGFTVSLYEKKKIVYTKSEVSSELKFAAMIPDFYLATKKSRGILPKYVSMKSASYNISHAALLSAALTKNDSSFLKYCFKDRLHQKYRFNMIKSGEYIIRNARRMGAYGGYISGAGPTIMIVTGSKNTDFEYNMNELIKTNLKNWRLIMLDADNTGAVTE